LKIKHDLLQSKLDSLNVMKNNMLKNISDAFSYKKVYEEYSKKIFNLKGAIFNYKAQMADQEATGNKKDCSGMPGYSSPLEGNGLNA